LIGTSPAWGDYDKGARPLRKAIDMLIGTA
jgi:hypothetical protein